MRRGQRRGRSWVCRRCITTRHINDARTVAIGIVGIVIITIVPIIVNVRSDQYSISSVIFDEVKRLSCPRIDAYLTIKNCPRPKRSVVSSQTMEQQRSNKKLTWPPTRTAITPAYDTNHNVMLLRRVLDHRKEWPPRVTLTTVHATLNARIAARVRIACTDH